MTRKHILIAAASTVAVLGGAAVTASAMIERGPMRADTNGDGIVSRSEFFAAAQARFARHDRDGDRILAGTELQDRRGRFARLDTNNDGRLTFAEQAAGTAARFTRLDVDRDGKLTPEELGPAHRHGPHGRDPALAQGPAGDPPSPGAAMLRRIDANGDRRITRDEMRAQADRRFDRIDANRDGVLDQAELQALRGPGVGGPGGGRRDWRDQGMDDTPAPPPPPPPSSPPQDDR